MSWVTSLLLAVIAACAAWVAFQQWVVARLKLNHDLFERRFAVFVATQNYLVACLNRDGGTYEDTGAFYEATRAAPFLFDKDINEFLAAVMKHSVNIQVFGKHIDKLTLRDWQKFMDIYHNSQEWAGEAYASITQRLQPTLSLSNINPFSIGQFIPIPDGKVLRDKLTASFKGTENGSS